MRTIEEAIIHDCFSFLNSVNQNLDYEITSIYYRKNEASAVDVIACVVDNTSRTEIQTFDPYKNHTIFQQVWDFDIDQYDLKCLEDGYEILYMPIATHMDMWINIDNVISEPLQHLEGLQKYLHYCKQHGINKELIDTLMLVNVEDAMTHYREKNHNYEITQSQDIGNASIVLGYNPKAPQPYVVWDSDRNRKYGYGNGDYQTKKVDAIACFESRCKKQLEHDLNFKLRAITKKQKDKER